jgi:mannose-6-phosphate isomerase-like protein (cupin superfamily)
MPELVDKARAEHYIWGSLCDGWHLLKNAKLSVIQERMPPGTEEQRHYHERSQQFFYVLSGEAFIEVDGKDVRLAAGQGIHIEPAIAHQMKNTTSEDVHFLVVSQPPSHGDRILAPLR